MSNKKLLFLDDYHVERKKGFSLRLGDVCRDGKPVLIPDQPWEAGGIIGDSNCTVIDDNGRLRMWYCIANRPRNWSRDTMPTEAELAALDEKTRNDLMHEGEAMLCHAVSEDGVDWDKSPACLVEHNDGKATNMLLPGRMGATVFIDPVDIPERRYKMIHGYGPRLPHRVPWSSPTREIFYGIYGSYSPDGLNWTTYPGQIMEWYTDTTNVAYYDKQLGKYVAFVRMNQNLEFRDRGTCPVKRGAEHYRTIGRSESDDFFNFPHPEKIAEPSPRQRRPRATGLDYYNSAAMIHPGTDDVYVMLSSNFYHEQDALQVHLATSRDGVNYSRWIQPLLTPGTEGLFDSGSVYMATGAVCRGDEMWLYYRGCNWLHGKLPPPPRGGAIGRVRMRRDGFACQEARPGGGELLTTPVKVSGERLTVNLDAGAGGRLKVELRDLGGAPIPGYTEADADWLFYNDLHRTVTWNGSADIPSTSSGEVRLRFIGANARLYACEFVGEGARGQVISRRARGLT